MSGKMNHEGVNRQKKVTGVSGSSNEAATGKVTVWFDGGGKNYQYHSDYAAIDGLGVSLTDLHKALASRDGKLQTGKGEVQVCWTAQLDAFCRAYNRAWIVGWALGKKGYVHGMMRTTMDDSAIERLITRRAHSEMHGKWMRMTGELVAYTRYLEEHGVVPDAASEQVGEYVAGICDWMDEVGRLLEEREWMNKPIAITDDGLIVWMTLQFGRIRWEAAFACT
jgi:hypothetical protein